MGLKSYLSIMILVLAASGAGFWFILDNINPDSTNWIGFVLFYAALFIVISSIVSVIGFLIRFLFLRRQFASYAVKTAFRQAFFAGIFFVIALILLAYDLFTWWNAVLLLICLAILEYAFICYETEMPTIDIDNEGESVVEDASQNY